MTRRMVFVMLVVNTLAAIATTFVLGYADWAESANYAAAKTEQPKWRQSQRKLSGWRDDVAVYVITVTDPAGQRSNHVCFKTDVALSCNLIPSER